MGSCEAPIPCRKKIVPVRQCPFLQVLECADLATISPSLQNLLRETLPLPNTVEGTVF
jgi:hypothetical protein